MTSLFGIIEPLYTKFAHWTKNQGSRKNKGFLKSSAIVGLV